MLSSNLLKSKIPILWGGGGVFFFTEFDAEFKFANIQNSHFVWGGVQLLMLSPNLLKKKKFCKKFSKFSDKKHNGFVLDFEYQVVRLYEV